MMKIFRKINTIFQAILPLFNYYLSSKGNDKYSIRLVYQGRTVYQTKDEIEKRLRIYQQILSTFKFLP